jgi:hypothetical protein
MLSINQILDWKNVIAETTIVAIGVVMALAVDAWWEDRTDRVTESVYLQGLLEDFSTTALDLNGEAESALESLSAIDELLGLMTSKTTADSSHVHRTISTAFETSVLRPVTATYADLVTSGNTRILRSKSLRFALAEWSAQLEIHQRLEDHILAPHYLVINNFMIRNVAVSDPWQAGQKLKSPFYPDFSDLLINRELWNLLVVHRNWEGARKASLSALQHRIDQVLEQLEHDGRK